MDSSKSNNMPLIEQEEEDLKQLKTSLPKELFFTTSLMYFYQGFWCSYLDSTIAVQTQFQALETDIFITGIRKSGTTWLKALLFTICNRETYTFSESPLLTRNPHGLIPQLETNVYWKPKCPNFSNITSPRLFGTHIPYSSLPDSMKESNCKMIYTCRNPLDTFISSWFFYLESYGKETVKPDMIAEYFDKFCEGRLPYGPFEDHVLGYWKASIERPDKVLFVKYEDLKANPKDQLKRLAEFVGYPFTVHEEKAGVIEDIIELCSFEKMKEITVNKSGGKMRHVPNKLFFRKGEVGDWVNHLTPAMAERLEKTMEEKFKGTGFTFK